MAGFFCKSGRKGDYETLKGTYAGDGNKETILALKFTATQDYNGNNDSNRWQVMLGMRQLNAAPYCKGWGALTVNPDFVEAFPSGDLRRSASIIDLVGKESPVRPTLPPVLMTGVNIPAML